MIEYPPKTFSGWLGWSGDFSTAISATPTAFSLTAAQATAFAAVRATYATAYAAANNPATRGPSTIQTKNDALFQMKKQASALTKTVQAALTTSNTQRVNLGLKVPVIPQSIGIPGVSPKMDIDGVDGRRVSLKIHNADTTKRGKPAGVAGASVYSFVGEQPPEDVNAWAFEGNTTRTKFDVLFSGNVPPFAKVWLTCLWFNPRQMAGPACTPQATNLGAWVVQNVEGGGTQNAANLKVAA